MESIKNKLIKQNLQENHIQYLYYFIILCAYAFFGEIK